ncbi:MAG TPA: transporter [Rhodanobacteraceae bacterium]|nr:transporter [Rhodanobacteraceae bacterium]
MARRWLAIAAATLSLPALAGPPYITDDAEPTATGHYEIYFFADGASARDGRDGSAGIDFNYGAADNLQLTATLPLAWTAPAGGGGASSLGNIELAAKYKFLHQRQAGVDVAFFPRVFLPAGSSAVGENHVSLLLPLWLQRSSGAWTVFGGGGCEIHRGGDSRDFCMLGAAFTCQVNERFQIGTEVYHQTADTRGGVASTDFDVGATYDLGPHFHLMASAGPGLQNRSRTDRVVWYAALLWTR